MLRKKNVVSISNVSVFDSHGNNRIRIRPQTVIEHARLAAVDDQQADRFVIASMRADNLRYYTPKSGFIPKHLVIVSSLVCNLFYALTAIALQRRHEVGD